MAQLGGPGAVGMSHMSPLGVVAPPVPSTEAQGEAASSVLNPQG